MNQSKVYSQGNVPFSWENKPGISKVKYSSSDVKGKLPPPPYHSDSSPKVLGGQETLLQVPLPPCLFQTPVRSSSRKGGLRRKDEDDDPFFAAYKEVTKSGKQGKLGKSSSKKGSSRAKEGRTGGLFSCKHSCSVREDSLVVKMSSAHVPRERLDFSAE
ncbi:hypothetical protein ACHQM5_024801 [Ranunculus cassubicifolius]